MFVFITFVTLESSQYFLISNGSVFMENDQPYRIESVGFMKMCMFDGIKCIEIQVRLFI